MSFIESPSFPICVGLECTFTHSFSTTVLELANGREVRNANRARSRMSAQVRIVPDASDNGPMSQVRALFQLAMGAQRGFRVRDHSDYKVDHSTGVLTSLTGGDGPQWQLARRYTFGSNFSDRPIRKPATITEQRKGGVLWSPPSTDLTTGIVTLAPIQSRSITAHSAGSQHQVTLASAASPALLVGQFAYLDGATGTAAPLLNQRAHKIVGVSGLVLTLEINTAGLTCTGGTAASYLTELATWSGTFDVPMRFETDSMNVEVIDRRDEKSLWVQFSNCTLIEDLNI
jgi:uncharacterized protein (TIGR02217 family)